MAIYANVRFWLTCCAGHPCRYARGGRARAVNGTTTAVRTNLIFVATRGNQDDTMGVRDHAHPALFPQVKLCGAGGARTHDRGMLSWPRRHSPVSAQMHNRRSSLKEQPKSRTVALGVTSVFWRLRPRLCARQHEVSGSDSARRVDRRAAEGS